jgi:hypothetical protein
LQAKAAQKKQVRMPTHTLRMHRRYACGVSACACRSGSHAYAAHVACVAGCHAYATHAICVPRYMRYMRSVCVPDATHTLRI